MSGSVLAAALAVTVAACGDGTHGGVRPATGARTVNVSERDFKMTVSTAAVAAGSVIFRSHNEGPDTHEVIVVRVPPGVRHLPLRADGITVDEELLKPDVVGSINFVAPGGSGSTTLRVTPGRYVLLCNMSGHYLAGMHVDLLVTPR